MAQHIFGYSKSTKSRCHGPPPCKDTPLPVGALRYGRITSSDVGNKVEWCHWGCTSPESLRELAVADLDQIQGYQELSNPDRHKIRMAIARGRVDPADIPDTAKANLAEAPSGASASNSRKRKVQEDVRSQPGNFQSDPFSPGMSEEPEEDDRPEEETRDELYCTLQDKVVGIQYYDGLVGPGEEVLLVREPQNPYDRNAIQVKNIGGKQVGHLPRQIAAKLASLLDRQAITVEGEINDGNLTKKSYALSITLKLYGPSEKRAELERELRWAAPRQRGHSNQGVSSLSHSSSVLSGRVPYPSAGPSQRTQSSRDMSHDLRKAAELRQILDKLEKVDDEGRRNSLLDSICSGEDVLDLPMHPAPPGIHSGELLTDLLPHQAQALQWCYERENPVLPTAESDKPAQFWQMRKLGSKPYYFNVATKTPQEAPPILGRGAICADAMGLGKTLTMLALIIATKNDAPPDYSKTTLIISPLSILSNWEQQINEHCAPGTLQYITYYGANRSFSPQELVKYDVVLTTYQTVSGEHAVELTSGASGPSRKRKKMGNTLFSVQWKRIILDEGHIIRNPKTKTTKSVCALAAQRRWILSGTPIINSPNDLGSLLTFLRICRPLDGEDLFRRLVLRPLKYGQSEGVELLRALMGHICIRRTKEMQDSQGNTLIKLPPVEMIRVPVKLNDDARRLYDEVAALAHQRLRKLLQQSSNTNSNLIQTNALAMLTRLRQLALHPGLIPENYIEELRGTNDKPSHSSTILSPEEKFRLQGKLSRAIEDCEECPICISLPDEPRITVCGHIFCLPCITETISRDSKCPMDRRPISLGDLYEPLPTMECTQPSATINDDPVTDQTKSSAKVERLIDLLKLLPPTDKSLVFSQFTTFMDKIAEAFDDAGVSYVRFDGQMSAKRRKEAIARFSVPISSQATAAQDQNSPDPMTESDSEFLADEDPAFIASTKRKGNAKSKTKHFRDEENPRVMLISLKAGALGLNLTVANNVFLMDPWWQEGIESQAIDRVNRIGQRKPVHVYQFIAEDTVESKVLDIQERKKNLIKQAFSGVKSREKQRQHKEVKFQDLIEILGVQSQGK